MNNNLFFVDKFHNVTLRYDKLDESLNGFEFCTLIKESSVLNIILNIYISLLLDKEIILFDSDSADISEYKSEIIILDQLYKIDLCVNNINNWKIGLFTSGTTGEPKLVFHKFNSISRNIKVNKFRNTDIWGFTYNPLHIAGVQLLLQAFFNKNPIINLYKYPPNQIVDIINEYDVNSLSGTPTFYRMISSMNIQLPKIVNLTLGGEATEKSLLNKLESIFPNAKIRNIYASTEAGTILKSENDIFEIDNKSKHLIKIIENVLYIHKELLGEIKNGNEKDEWFDTGDIIELISDKPLRFKIISRKDDITNIGGEKVNVIEVEHVIRSIKGVNNVSVYVKSNSVVGKILCADVLLNTSCKLNEKLLKDELKKYISSHKIPRIINFVNSLQLTKSNKIKRIE